MVDGDIMCKLAIYNCLHMAFCVTWLLIIVCNSIDSEKQTPSNTYASRRDSFYRDLSSFDRLLYSSHRRKDNTIDKLKLKI